MSQSIEINSESVAAAVTEALAAIGASANLAELKALKSTLIGEQSPIAKLNATLKNLPNDQKASAGALIGQARGEIRGQIADIVLVAKVQHRLDRGGQHQQPFSPTRDFT